MVQEFTDEGMDERGAEAAEECTWSGKSAKASLLGTWYERVMSYISLRPWFLPRALGPALLAVVLAFVWFHFQTEAGPVTTWFDLRQALALQSSTALGAV